MKKKFFEVVVGNGIEQWCVCAPSSLDSPADNTVMFAMERCVQNWKQLLKVSHCMVFWPIGHPVFDELASRHAVIPCDNPRLEYARFFQKHHIRNLPENIPTTRINGSYISDRAFLGKEVTVMPGAYIGAEVSIGDHTYIGSGACLSGKISIGNHVTVRENTVLGADGLAMERETDGRMIPIPQFGGICIEDDVQIGANVTIARGSIDDTVIGKGSMIDNNCFISHNVKLGENVAVVGESILFGSSEIGKNCFISGNVTVRDEKKIGKNSLVGMGSVVVKDIAENTVVMGNPAMSAKKS